MTLRYIKLRDGYAKYIINRESDTDFWFIFGMKSKNDRYYFIEELVNSLDRGYYGDKYKSAIRGNLVTFSKYYIFKIWHTRRLLCQRCLTYL